jgi:hypothetical protein
MSTATSYQKQLNQVYFQINSDTISFHMGAVAILQTDAKLSHMPMLSKRFANLNSLINPGYYRQD